MLDNNPEIEIREAREADFDFVVNVMTDALTPYYGGDHKAHAGRIFSTHISGGLDRIGHFSLEQKMFILTVDSIPAGMIHLVAKRQGTHKISPIIVAPEYRGKLGIGSRLLTYAEDYARRHNARQMYCTVAEENNGAQQFFLRKGYVVAGRSDSHYKEGITELMMYKLFVGDDLDGQFDLPNISVLPLEETYESQVRSLLLDKLPKYFRGVDDEWVTALFEGYKRRHTDNINLKYKLIFTAVDRQETVLGVAAATPKKGEPIKVMPFVATTLPAFTALLTDIPFMLKPYGHKLYIHITPPPEETIELQRRGWRLDAAMPSAYHDDHITQQWSLDIRKGDFMRLMRTKQHFLDLIKQGRKSLEVRVGYDNIKTIQSGERIRLTSRADSQIIRVNDVRTYSTFEDMLEVEDADKIVPDLPKQEVFSLLKRIYPPKKEALGVFVLDIQPNGAPVSRRT